MKNKKNIVENSTVNPPFNLILSIYFIQLNSIGYLISLILKIKKKLNVENSYSGNFEIIFSEFL
jgi:hypothetical protein